MASVSKRRCNSGSVAGLGARARFTLPSAAPLAGFSFVLRAISSLPLVRPYPTALTGSRPSKQLHSVAMQPTISAPMDTPITQFAQAGEDLIAYQVVGEGPIDLFFMLGWVTQVDTMWELPAVARFLRRLASFSRLILFYTRGTGLSDRGLGTLPFETIVEDM